MSDLLFGSATGSDASSSENIALTHKLSKIEVNLSPGYGYVASDLDAAEVHLNNVKPTVTIDPTDGTLGSASGDAITITPRKDATTGTYEAVIPPQTLSNPDGLITVTTTKGGVTSTSSVINEVSTFAENTKYVYNVSVDKLVPEVHVGDYFYEDGTWSTNYKKGHGAVVGLVFSTETSAADKAAGYPHGYVVALTNVNNVAWSTSAGLTGMGVVADSNRDIWKAAVLADLDGLSHTNYIKENYASTYTSAFPAFNAALNYTPVASKTTYDNSGWYLPSTGQLYVFLYNFCNKITSWPSTAWFMPTYSHCDGVGAYVQTETRTPLNNYLNQRLNTDVVNAGGTAIPYSVFDGYSPSRNYWTSTEYNADFAYWLHFGGNESLWLLAWHQNMEKTKANQNGIQYFVRPVLAF